MCGGSRTTTINIVITATKDNQYPPALSDGNNTSTGSGDEKFTTVVTGGTVVNFIKAGDITSIDNVFYSGENKVFSSGPNQQKDGSWQGVIANLPNGTEEAYTIVYTVAGNQYKQDPKIRVNQ